MSWPERVTVYEVGPRDGLQNVADIVGSETKIAFVDALTAAGLPAVEVTAFVSPRWVPQLADAAEVLAAVAPQDACRHVALVPNLRGYEAARAAGAREVAVFTAASEEFNRRNVNASIDESLARFEPVLQRARADGVAVRGYLSTAFGCPFEGDVPAAAVARVVADLFSLGCAEVSVGDTIGVADPAQVRRVVDRLAARHDLGSLALHLHDTWGRGLANVVAALQAGITVFDSSAGGLGGCPYAPGATGNLATEDLVSLLDRLDIETGVDLGGVADASLALAAETGLALPSRALGAIRARHDRR